MRWGVLLLLAAVWLSLSGPYTVHEWLILVFGLVSVAFVWRLYAALDREAGGDWEFFHPAAWLRLPRFLVAFVYRVALANLHVVRLILAPGSELHPRLRRVRASQKTSFGQILYANFITLTPGTITLDLRRGELLVYALDAQSEADVVDGSMDRDVLRLEGPSD
ncbi:MAG: Na+/H+ antiporter subunit E [Acidobacteria bacterium]|nr:Na+/H+ antiporter subunit E [Acidobacteriota bacterium]